MVQDALQEQSETSNSTPVTGQDSRLPTAGRSGSKRSRELEGHLRSDIANHSLVIAQTTSKRVDRIRSLHLNTSLQTQCVITEILRNTAGHGLIDMPLRADGYAVCLHLTAFDDYDVWRDDTLLSSQRLQAGVIHISDMRHEWRADIRGAFHVVNFFVSQASLNEIATELGNGLIDELVCPIDSRHVDPILQNLASALIPALCQPEKSSKLFSDYAARAVIAHLANAYGSMKFEPKCTTGGLAPWQERRAKDMLLGNIAQDIGLPELARACRLSTSHFSHSFRKTVGCPPHQWLLTQRLEHAKRLMMNTKKPLSEIAFSAGFSDQSHFTRVFTKRVRASPAAWRRAQMR